MRYLLKIHNRQKKEKKKFFHDKVSEKNQGKKQIIFSLDTYDDIFSDFDPRPFSQRMLSDDFLNEAKKASIGGKRGLLFLIPKNEKSVQHETIIKRRLKEFFQKHSDIESKKLARLINNGIIYIILGNVIILVRTILLYNFALDRSFLATFFISLIETPSWFLIFEGLIMILFKSREQVPETVFYNKIKNADIEFKSF